MYRGAFRPDKRRAFCGGNEGFGRRDGQSEMKRFGSVTVFGWNYSIIYIV